MRVYQGKVSASTTLQVFLEEKSKLDPEKLALACEKGAVWLQRGGRGKILRVRDPRLKLSSGDSVQFFYDPKVLSLPELTGAYSLHETSHYGCWYKPPGAVTQGSQVGDHTSILRFVEKVKKKEIFLVHRLDRETEGLVLLAYDSKAAGVLSDLFQKHQIKKEYETIVRGEMTPGSTGSIDVSLDDKEALTHFEVISSKENMSLLRVNIETGRIHQIRRHLDHIGHPVMGDPKYGRGNKNRDGLKLLARGLEFLDPWTKLNVKFSLVKGLTL